MDNIIVTVINAESECEYINDYCFKNVKVKLENGSNILNSDEASESVGIFGSMFFFHEEGDTSLMDIFSDYEGEILAYNNADFLNTNVNHLKGVIPITKTYVVTGYNNK